MKLASVPLLVLLVLSAGLWALGGEPDRPDRGPDDRPGMREGDDGPPHGWWGRGKPMDSQQAQEALEVIRRIDPEKAQRLEKAIDENPERVGEVLHENFPMLGRFMAMRRYDPEGFDLRVKDLALSRKCSAAADRMRKALDAKDDAVAALELAQLQALVAEHFDVRQELREYELMKLKERIEELGDQLKQRTADRETLIDERVHELIGEGGGDRW
ncbi:MAG: hypothetical protein R3C45_15140 [Phycisphaerales bacterium]